MSNKLEESLYTGAKITLVNNIVSSMIKPPKVNIYNILKSSPECEDIYRTYGKLIINEKPVSDALREEYKKCLKEDHNRIFQAQETPKVLE